MDACPRGVPVAIAALLALAATGGGAAMEPARSHGASLMPRGLDPLVIGGSGFRAASACASR